MPNQSWVLPWGACHGSSALILEADVQLGHQWWLTMWPTACGANMALAASWPSRRVWNWDPLARCGAHVPGLELGPSELPQDVKFSHGSHAMMSLKPHRGIEVRCVYSSCKNVSGQHRQIWGFLHKLSFVCCLHAIICDISFFTYVEPREWRVYCFQCFKHLGPSWNRVILCHLGPFRTILDHSEPFQTILDHSKPSWTISGHPWPFKTLLDHFRPTSTILDHPGPSWTTLDHLGQP